jgi:hypothetical protein
VLIPPATQGLVLSDLGLAIALEETEERS